MLIGIDKIAFNTPKTYLEMTDLAKARQIEPEKFTIGIGQEQMAVPTLDQDIVTMAASAASQVLNSADQDALGLFILGTESGVDQSKAASLYIKSLLKLPHHLRTFEIKEACYGATAGLMTAYDYVLSHPDKKALVIGSDIARYGLNTAGEVTQGAGAVAMLISANPKILALEKTTAVYSEDIQDFWRPNYSAAAFARGKYSTEEYLRFFSTTWQDWSEKTQASLADLKAICFHLPYTKMGLKALKTVLPQAKEAHQADLLANYQASILYSKQIGNIYTGSLYLGLVSLLEHKNRLQAGDRIGLFSYGSGAVGEFFTGVLQENYQAALNQQQHQEMLNQRTRLTISEYEAIFNQTLPTDGQTLSITPYDADSRFVLAEVAHHERIYQEK